MLKVKGGTSSPSLKSSQYRCLLQSAIASSSFLALLGRCPLSSKLFELLRRVLIVGVRAVSLAGDELASLIVHFGLKYQESAEADAGLPDAYLDELPAFAGERVADVDRLE